MKSLFLFLWLLPFAASTQISIFDCGAYIPVTENRIKSGPQLFYQTCIDLSDPAGYSFTGNDNYVIQSGTSIHISPGFSAGGLNSSGSVHLQILPQNPMSWDIAVMNDVPLNDIPRYQKLELGITLPEPLKTKLENFILKQENPGISMSAQDMINPFLEWELDVEAEFMHDASSTVQKVEGFFTIDKKRNYTTLLWDNIPSDYHMRVRFAPPENGLWTGRIRIRSHNVLVSESVSFSLFVNESGKHGYITVHPNGKNLELDGEVIFPVGQNFPHTDSYQELNEAVTGVPDPFNMMSGKTEFRNNVNGWQQYIDAVDQFGQMGGRFTRIFMAPHAGLVEWEKKGNYYRRMHHAAEIDSLIEVHEKNNMFVMFDLLLHNYFMTWGDYNTWEWDWDRHLYCSDRDASGNPIPCGSGNSTVQYGERYYPGPDIHPWELQHPVHPYNDNPGNYRDTNQHPKMPHDMFWAEDDIKYHEQRVRYYISRYGYSTSIYLWEQMDEVFHMSEDNYEKTRVSKTDFYSDPTSEFYEKTHDAVNNYVRRMNKFIRENMRHKHQLLAVNVTGLSSYINGQLVSGFQHDSSRFDPNGDCLARSYYPVNPDEMIKESDIGYHDDPDYNNIFYGDEKTAAYQDVLRYRADYYAVNGRSVPLLIAESGSDAGKFPDKACMKGTDEFIDNMRFGFFGAAGFNKWHYFPENEYGVYENIIRAEKHMNGQDVKSVIGTADYLQGRQYEVLNFGSLESKKGAVLEMQYYLRADKSSAVGYVYNRTVNYKTASGGNCYFNSGEFDKDNFNDLHEFDWHDDGPSKRLKLKGLPNGSDYNVDFYGYPNGSYLSSYTAHVGSNDKFIVEFPELNQDRAVVWFVARKLQNKSLFTANLESGDLSDLLFPNPASSTLSVPKICGDFVVQNALGQLQESKIVSDERDYILIDISQYAPGVFYIVGDENTIPLKFVKL